MIIKDEMQCLRRLWLQTGRNLTHVSAAAILILLTLPRWSFAQDEAVASSPDSPSVFSSLKVKLANGVVDTVNNSKKADVLLQWNVLPLGTQTQEQAARDKIVPVEFSFANGDLAAGTFLAGLNTRTTGITEADRLSGAIGGPSFDLDAWHGAFQENWKPTNPVVARLLQDQILTVREYIGLLHDHDILYTLLKSRGFNVELRMADEDVLVKNLPTVIQDSRWRIRQYRFVLSNGGGPPNGPTVAYRYSVSMDAPRFTLVFPKDVEDKVTLEARARWVPPPGQEASAIWRLGVTQAGFAFQDVEIAPDDVAKEKLDEIEEDNGGPSRFETQLSTFTGVSPGDVATKNLLGGGKNVSIVTGGLIGKNLLKPVIGLNLELGQTGAPTQPGFLFGVETGGSDALYAGPSFRAGIFTFSVGTRLATEDRSDRDPPGNGSFVKGDFGGFIALDLSRLLGGKRTTTALKLNQEVFGGDLGLSSDEVADNLSGLLPTVKIAPGAKLKRGDLRLRRIEDEAGDEIKGGTVVNIDPRSGDRLLFLPPGRYKWETRLGAGVIVRSQGEIVKDGDPGPSLTSDDPVIRIAIDVELAPPP